MYIGQRPATRALLLDTRRPCGFPEHPALGDEHDVTFGKLFLELPRKPETKIRSVPKNTLSWNGNPDAPCLNLVEGLELGDRDKNNNGLLATTDINLPGSRDLQSAELSLEIGDIVFEVNQSLSDLDFGFIWRSGGRIGGTGDFVLERHVET